METKQGKRVEVMAYIDAVQINTADNISDEEQYVHITQHVQRKVQQGSMSLLSLAFGASTVFSGVLILFNIIHNVEQYQLSQQKSEGPSGLHYAAPLAPEWALQNCVIYIALFATMTLCYRTAIKCLHKAEEINPGIPITRANSADLSASESLVRASTEPTQAQQAVLLRAAAEGVDTPPEEMLRAVGQE